MISIQDSNFIHKSDFRAPQVTALRITKRRLTTIGQVLTIEFLKPLNVEISQLSDAIGVHRNTLSRIVNDKGALTDP